MPSLMLNKIRNSFQDPSIRRIFDRLTMKLNSDSKIQEQIPRNDYQCFTLLYQPQVKKHMDRLSPNLAIDSLPCAITATYNFLAIKTNLQTFAHLVLNAYLTLFPNAKLPFMDAWFTTKLAIEIVRTNYPLRRILPPTPFSDLKVPTHAETKYIVFDAQKQHFFTTSKPHKKELIYIAFGTPQTTQPTTTIPNQLVLGATPGTKNRKLTQFGFTINSKSKINDSAPPAKQFQPKPKTFTRERPQRTTSQPFKLQSSRSSTTYPIFKKKLDSQDHSYRVLHWNIHGCGNPQLWWQKVTYIKSKNPCVIALNETYKETPKLLNYDSFHAHPARILNGRTKLNSTLILHQSLKAKVLSRSINYISAVTPTIHPFKRPTLIACLYINPHRDEVNKAINSQTLNSLIGDIHSVNDKQQYNLIICGDFNLQFRYSYLIAFRYQLYKAFAISYFRGYLKIKLLKKVQIMLEITYFFK